MTIAAANILAAPAGAPAAAGQPAPAAGFAFAMDVALVAAPAAPAAIPAAAPPAALGKPLAPMLLTGEVAAAEPAQLPADALARPKPLTTNPLAATPAAPTMCAPPAALASEAAATGEPASAASTEIFDSGLSTGTEQETSSAGGAAQADALVPAAAPVPPAAASHAPALAASVIAVTPATFRPAASVPGAEAATDPNASDAGALAVDRSPAARDAASAIALDPAPRPPPAGFADRLAAADAATPPLAAQPGAEPVAAPSLGAGASTVAGVAPVTPAAVSAQPIVSAEPGRIGREIGVEIARRLTAGGDELTVRLNPVELGRIDVRLSFDERGGLRAVVAAEPAALDMLRRDSADLGRALQDAGVRADAGSFRFDARSGGGEGGQHGGRQPSANPAWRHGAEPSDDALDTAIIYRPLRTNARVDLLA